MVILAVLTSVLAGRFLLPGNGFTAAHGYRALYLFPIVITAVGDPDWYRRLRQIAPMNAGLSIQDTIDLGSQPLSPWAGIGVLTAWAAGGLLAGAAVLRLRDA